MTTISTLHRDCSPCGNPAWIGCCEVCTARAAFLAHVLAPFNPEPVALARAA